MRIPALRPRTKIVGAIAVAACPPAIVGLVLTLVLGRRLVEVARVQLEGQAQVDLGRLAKSLYIYAREHPT
jgi:hypothetical protein